MYYYYTIRTAVLGNLLCRGVRGTCDLLIGGKLAHLRNLSVVLVCLMLAKVLLLSVAGLLKSAHVTLTVMSSVLQRLIFHSD